MEEDIPGLVVSYQEKGNNIDWYDNSVWSEERLR
jgi:hypothetical protein